MRRMNGNSGMTGGWLGAGLVLAAILCAGSALAAGQPQAAQATRTPLMRLRALLPKYTGDFALKRISEPQADGRVTVSGLYVARDGRSFHLELREYVPPQARPAAPAGATRENYRGHDLYLRDAPAELRLPIGAHCEVRAYPEGEKVTLQQLRWALGPVDFDGIRYFDEDLTAPAPSPGRTAQRKGDAGPSCDAINPQIQRQLMAQFGARPVPWARLLTETQAASAKRNDPQLAFPREDNPWLACVRKNDLLWAPFGAHAFLLRVLTMRKTDQRVVFTTKKAALTSAIH